MNKNKFSILYYTGLSIIISAVFIITITIVSVGTLIVKSFNNKTEVAVVKQKSVKKVIYDTVKVQVQVLDTVKVKSHKIKPVVKLEEKIDTIK